MRWLAAGVLAACSGTADSAPLRAEPGFTAVELQYIAALGEPGARSGTGAERWGVWRKDPGPRGVRLSGFGALTAAGGLAPAGWTFDPNDWWLEEHGLIMEGPEIGLPPGQYQVTGGRDVEAVLTVHPRDADGRSRWDLSEGATLLDVTHLRCRSARYQPAADGGSCTPAAVRSSAFPVAPGAAMPAVAGCRHEDYAVLFLTAVRTQQGPARP